MTLSAELLHFAAGLVVLVGTTVLIGWRCRIGLGWAPATAVGRATAQLTVVALLLQGILSAPVSVIAFLALMLLTASLTAGTRLRDVWHGRRAAVAGVVCGAAAALSAVIVLGLVELDVRVLVAVSGIVIGGAMSAATLAGRHFIHGAHQRRDEVEAWLVLGATSSQAHQEIGRVAVRESLLATLDQTRSTGLVTLPGAFVGALFGGASPAEAARFQLVVLAGIAMAMTVCAVLVTRLLGRSPHVVVSVPSG